MSGIPLFAFLLSSIVISGFAEEYCSVQDDILSEPVSLKLCNGALPKDCKDSGQVSASNSNSQDAKCLKCMVPGKSCSKDEDCCSGRPDSIGAIGQGKCFAGKCTVCAPNGKACVEKKELCCGAEKDDGIACRPENILAGKSYYVCKADPCKSGDKKKFGNCMIEGYNPTLPRKACDCTKTAKGEYQDFECRDKECTPCKSYRGECSGKEECCGEGDCINIKLEGDKKAKKRCQPKCLGEYALCKGLPTKVSCCDGLTCKKAFNKDTCMPK